MKKDILNKIIQSTYKIENLKKDEFFFIIASMIMYFNTQLSKEVWNTFPKKIEQGIIDLDTAVLMSEEEKNPEYFLNPKILKKDKIELKDKLFNILIDTKKNIQDKLSFSEDKIIIIPDIVDSTQFTIFPKMYLHKLIKENNYNNELTGQPLAWNVVEAIKTNTPLHKLFTKKITKETLLQYINSDLDKLQRITNRCIACKCSKIIYKSMFESQCIYFCSLECMKKFEI